MSLTKLAIKRPVSIIIMVIALIVFGSSAILGTPMELTPDMELPVLLVMTTYGGAGPEDVEEQVTKVVEDTVSTLSGMKNITSNSQENASMVMIELDYGTDIDVAHMDLQEKLNMITNSLPDDASSPIIIEMSMDMMPVIIFSAEKTGNVDMLNYINDNIKPEFEKLSGVAQVEIYGGEESYVSVRLNEERMKQYHLNMNTLIGIVGAADFSMPAGSVERGNASLALRGGVSYDTIESLKNIPITIGVNKVIHLSDVADIYPATREATSISRYNGNENVMLSITKRQSASTVDVTQSAVKTMERLNASNNGIHMSVIQDSSEQIIASVQAVLSTLALGILLSMLVLFMFFGDVKASLIVGSSMPVSVLASLIIMSMCGFSLNVVSLGGLVIGVGMMVDNSIVVIESCYRRREQNVTFRQAAIEGTKIVTSSIVAGTLTTVVVYLPISIMSGMSGQMFKQLGFTIIFSLSCSLLSALTIVPLLFTKLRPKEKNDIPLNRMITKIQRVYGTFLKKTFRVKWLVVLVSIGLLVGSFMMVGSGAIPFELMPSVDEGTISFAVRTKPGLKLENSDALMRDLEALVAQSPDVENYSLSLSSGSANLDVYLRGDRKNPTSYWLDTWREQTKGYMDCDISITSSSATSSMGGSDDIQIPLRGNDYDMLKQASTMVETELRKNPNIVRVESSVSSGDPQAEINVDPIKAAAFGFTPQQVIQTVYTMTNGSSPTSLRFDGQEYDIRIEYPDDRFDTVEKLSGLILSSQSGREVALLDMAEIAYTNAPTVISRHNKQYNIIISAQPTTAAKYTAQDEVYAAVGQMQLPAGVSIGMSSSMESMQEEFSALIGAILTAVLLVFMVMAVQFESIRFSLIVMICIPFSMIGAFGGLLATGSSLSMTSMMGFLTLVGTVINNGILFIDTTNQYRSSMDAETALIMAGRTRLRPILMTTLTTVLSMIPMAIGMGESAEMMRGMAIVIIGGLTASTILTLLLLPTFYLLFRGKQTKKDDVDPEDTQLPAHEEFSVDELIQS